MRTFQIKEIDDKEYSNGKRVLLKFEDGGQNTLADFRDVPGAAEHAATIVRAVNSHEELLNAIVYAINHLEQLQGEGVAVNSITLNMLMKARAKAETLEKGE